MCLKVLLLHHPIHSLYVAVLFSLLCSSLLVFSIDVMPWDALGLCAPRSSHRLKTKRSAEK